MFAPGDGPRLHHAAFSIPESYHFFYVCDLAAEMGFGAGQIKKREFRANKTGGHITRLVID